MGNLNMVGPWAITLLYLKYYPLLRRVVATHGYCSIARGPGANQSWELRIDHIRTRRATAGGALPCKPLIEHAQAQP